jgi:hypothetical protein
MKANDAGALAPVQCCLCRRRTQRRRPALAVTWLNVVGGARLRLPAAIRAGIFTIQDDTRKCRLWVISRHNGPFASCPLYPR